MLDNTDRGESGTDDLLAQLGSLVNCALADLRRLAEEIAARKEAVGWKR